MLCFYFIFLMKLLCLVYIIKKNYIFCQLLQNYHSEKNKSGVTIPLWLEQHVSVRPCILTCASLRSSLSIPLLQLFSILNKQRYNCRPTVQVYNFIAYIIKLFHFCVFDMFYPLKSFEWELNANLNVKCELWKNGGFFNIKLISSFDVTKLKCKCMLSVIFYHCYKYLSSCFIHFFLKYQHRSANVLLCT